jgi:cell wall-associated NlpC family hydrolase
MSTRPRGCPRDAVRLRSVILRDVGGNGGVGNGSANSGGGAPGCGMTGRRITRLLLGALVLFGLGGLGFASSVGATTTGPSGGTGGSGGSGGAPTSSGGLIASNFWLASAQGDVWNFGQAPSLGSAGGLTLAHPIVGITPTPDGQGYWLVASDGGIFTFGDAKFFGSTGAIALNKPIVAMASTPDGQGYWLVASDGGIFTFGDAPYFGSTAGASVEPAEKVVPVPSGQGYWIEDQNGTMYPFGTVQATPPTAALLLQPVTPGDKAVLYAFTQLGKPYIWGGNGPTGYDCSGLVLASWKHADGVTFARVADDQYHTAGQPVAPPSLAAGDLVFWGTSQTDWTTVYHTAMYVGGDRIVESTDGGVQLNSLGQWGEGDIMPMGRRP